MWNRSRDHLVTAGETYIEHMRFALLVGLITGGAALACLVHALVPGLCEQTCSRTLAQLNSLFAARRRLNHFEEQASGVITFAALVLLATMTAVLPVVLGGGTALSVVIAALAFSIPAAFLSTNPQLESVAENARDRESHFQFYLGSGAK